jgi:tetratricopeptide (TPR) repeat protein
MTAAKRPFAACGKLMRGRIFGKPGRESMIEINRLRAMPAHPRVGPSHRYGAEAIVRFIVVILCGLVVISCASVPAETPYNLGVAAYKKRNYSEAAAQWTKAVASGNTEAMNNLGFLLYNGYGVDKDTDRAIKLWRIASEAGESESQWHLGRAYETGIGVERSPSKAYAWYVCAIQSASNNSTAADKDHNTESEILKDAKGSFDKIKDGLSASDLEMGRTLAVEYIARYGKPSP